MSNLCYIGGYPDQALRALHGTMFVYLQVKALAKYFDHIYVISHRVWVPRLLRHLPFIPAKIREKARFYDYSHDNTRVFFPKYPPWRQGMPPHEFFPHHLRLVEGVIERHRLRFDWVQAYFSVPMGATAVAVARRHGARSLVTIGENDEWFAGAVAGRHPVYMNCWQHANHLGVVNHKYAHMLAAAGIERSKIRYLPNGFDSALVPRQDKAALRSRLGIGQDEFVFVNVAFLEPKKDHETLLRAFQWLRAAGKTAKLFIIGNGPLMSKVERQIRELGLSEDVRLLGCLPPRKVLEWNRAADVCVNYSKAEGNPTVMFEALGCGRPYIGSAVGGVPEIISDDRLGLIGPAGSAEVLCSLMLDAMSRTWDEHYIQNAASQYSWERIAEKLHDEVYMSSTSVSGARLRSPEADIA